MTETLIYGVDGLSNRVIQRMGREELPNIHKIQKQTDENHGDFQSYICEGYDAPHTGPMWNSLYTGLKPEEHGLMSGGWEQGDSKFHQMYTVWDKLSEETDKDIALYGMPMTYRAKPIQGWMISGFVSPTIKSLFDNMTYNVEVDNDFLELTSAYMAQVEFDGIHQGVDTEDFMDVFQPGEYERLDKFKEIIRNKEEKPDIVGYGTTYADKIGHAEEVRPQNKYTRQVYKDIDKILGELLETLDPENVIIISDHGFSGISHDLYGYYATTTGHDMKTVFDFTPALLKQHGIKFNEDEYGEKQGEDLDEEESQQIKDQLEGLGYF